MYWRPEATVTKAVTQIKYIFRNCRLIRPLDNTIRMVITCMHVVALLKIEGLTLISV